MKRITIFSTYEISEEADINDTQSYKASDILVELKDGVTIQNVLDKHNEKIKAIESKLLK
jgi:hypothetical protein